MNQCKKIQDLFYPYIEGTLDKRQEELLFKHLESCPACQEEFTFVKAIQNELHSQPEVPLPENFNIALREKLVKANLETPQKKNLLSYLPRYGLAVSAVAVFAIMIFAHNVNLQPAEYPSGSDIQGITPLPAATASSSPEQQMNRLDQAQVQEAGDTQMQADPDTETELPNTSDKISNNAPSDNKKTATKAPKPTVRPARTNTPSKTPTPYTDSDNNGKTSENTGGGSGASNYVNPTSDNETISENPQTPRETRAIQMIFVIHGSADKETMDSLKALQSFQQIDGNRYQIQRAYQNQLILALKNVEYSIHFASEAGRFGDDTIIIELI